MAFILFTTFRTIATVDINILVMPMGQRKVKIQTDQDKSVPETLMRLYDEMNRNT